MILIGVSGKAGSGKNFVADQIMAKYPLTRQLAFADPLKHMVAHMFNIPLMDLYTEEGKARPSWFKWEWCDRCTTSDNPAEPAGFMTNRDLLQWVGTELVRECWYQNHWIELAKQRIQQQSADIVVITDVRFPNEADLIKEMGGTVLKVTGRETAGVARHSGEAVDVIQADGVVINTPGTSPGMIISQVERLVPAVATLTAAVPLCEPDQP